MNINKKKLTNEYKKRYKLGQFFTSDKLVSYISNVFDIDYNNKKILEPSFGGCSFIKYIVEHSDASEVTAVDIDKKLCEQYSKIYKNIKFICKDFLGFESKELYDIIIGNPPFNLKTKYNYIDTTEGFLKKSLMMLKPNGTLYFVMPSTILRNKQYQDLRDYIISKYEILGIINTSKFEFLGANIETVVIAIKNNSVQNQQYFYIENNSSHIVNLTLNRRQTILIRSVDLMEKLKNSFKNLLLCDLFYIYRGKCKNLNCIKGRDLNYFGYYTENTKNNNYFIGLQNIAYRFTANLIQGELSCVNDTITILQPKYDSDYKHLCFISEYLNSSIGYYLLHINSLNGCKLTTHLDRYYIEDVFVPQYDESFNKYLKDISCLTCTKDMEIYRNQYFYNLLKLSIDDIKNIEQLWTSPVFKKKKKYILGDKNDANK